MAKKSQENYLDYIPAHAEKHEWSVDESGKVTIHMVHTGLYDKIAQKFFHRPRVSHIDLDEQGSYIWQQIDGQRTVGQLAEMMKQRFGAKAEPLYDRLVQYMKILYNNKFITYCERGKATK